MSVVAPPARMSDPEARECRCEDCDHVDWVGGLGGIAPTAGIVADVCHRDPCPRCNGQMKPAHPFVLGVFGQVGENND